MNLLQAVEQGITCVDLDILVKHANDTIYTSLDHLSIRLPRKTIPLHHLVWRISK